jgi:hypothetical protein
MRSLPGMSGKGVYGQGGGIPGFIDAPSITPLSYPGLQSWHEADRMNSVLANNAPVGIGIDQGQLGNDVIQNTGAARPLLIKGVLRGHSVFRFDGVNDRLTRLAYPDFGDNFTVYTVAALSSLATAVSHEICEVSTGVANTGFAIALIASHAVDVVVRDAIGLQQVITGAGFNDGVFRIYACIVTGTAINLYINDVLLATSAYTAPNPNILSQFDIGSTGDGLNFFFGDIAETIVYNVTHTDAIRTQLMNLYLQPKYFRLP